MSLPSRAMLASMSCRSLYRNLSHTVYSVRVQVLAISRARTARMITTITTTAA